MELKEYTFVEITRIKLLSEPSVRGVVDTKVPYQLLWEFQEKKIFFQKFKLIINSIFCEELKEYTFVEISSDKLLSEPPPFLSIIFCVRKICHKKLLN